MLLSPDSAIRYQDSLNERVAILSKSGEDGARRLRGHIVNHHFRPYILARMGVAQFDYEVAQRAGVPMNWAVKQAYLLLKSGWTAEYSWQVRVRPSPKESQVFKRHQREWNEKWCKEMVIRNLRLIDQLGLSPVDWDRLEDTFPGAKVLGLNLDRDTYDGVFDGTPEPDPERKAILSRLFS